MIKPIETVYGGYRFRSRLEARWAVFFDTLGIAYQYESAGFDLGGTWYLPDFWLPVQRYWIEIKPLVGSLDDWPNHPVWENPLPGGKFFLIVGDPYVTFSRFKGVRVEDQWSYNVFVSEDLYYRWCECPDCGFIGLTYDGRADRLSCKEGHGGDCPRHSGNKDKDYQTLTDRLVAAYREARQARFGRSKC